MSTYRYSKLRTHAFIRPAALSHNPNCIFLQFSRPISAIFVKIDFNLYYIRWMYVTLPQSSDAGHPKDSKNLEIMVAWVLGELTYSVLCHINFLTQIHTRWGKWFRFWREFIFSQIPHTIKQTHKVAVWVLSRHKANSQFNDITLFDTET